jgi:hypothetical protein
LKALNLSVAKAHHTYPEKGFSRSPDAAAEPFGLGPCFSERVPFETRLELAFERSTGLSNRLDLSTLDRIFAVASKARERN